MTYKKSEAGLAVSDIKVIFESELSKLSGDPELSKHPDPKFRAAYRDADELGETTLEERVEKTPGHVRKGASIPNEWLLRRSQKE